MKANENLKFYDKVKDELIENSSRMPIKNYDIKYLREDFDRLVASFLKNECFEIARMNLIRIALIGLRLQMQEGAEVDDILAELRGIYIIKNKKYGDSFGRQYRKYGLLSSFIRLEDKISRAEQLILNGESPTRDESLIDTLGDMVNYCIMTIVEIEKNQEQ